MTCIVLHSGITNSYKFLYPAHNPRKDLMKNYWLSVSSPLHYQSVRFMISFLRFDGGNEVFQANSAVEDYERSVFLLKLGCCALPEVPESRIFSSEQDVAYVVNYSLTQRYSGRQTRTLLAQLHSSSCSIKQLATRLRSSR